MKKIYLILSLIMATNVLASSKKEDWKPIYEKKKFKNILYTKDSDNKVSEQITPVKKEKALKIAPTVSVTSSKKPYSYQPKNSLEKLMLDKSGTKEQLKQIKASVFALKNKAVPTLINVMKSSDYPEKSRWWATFLLAKLTGTKSEAFIAKFYKHPAYFMRLAALKALHFLKNVKYKGLYALALKDKSMIVRTQALQNIRDLKLVTMAPSVWNMLYDKSNYNGDEGKLKRGSLIRMAIKTLGDLNFKKSKKAMLSMISSKKFVDVHVELDYALGKLTGKSSPKGTFVKKAHYWSRMNLSETTIN
jgi:hypothetical protein